MSDLLGSVLSGAAIQVEVSGLPPFTVNLDNQGAAPNPLIQALRPRVRLIRGGSSLYELAPYGDPQDGFPMGLVLVVLYVGFFLWLIFRR